METRLFAKKRKRPQRADVSDNDHGRRMTDPEHTMSRTSTVRTTYGRKPTGRTKPLLFYSTLPISPTDKRTRRRDLLSAAPTENTEDPENELEDLTEQLQWATLEDEPSPATPAPCRSKRAPRGKRKGGQAQQESGEDDAGGTVGVDGVDEIIDKLVASSIEEHEADEKAPARDKETAPAPDRAVAADDSALYDDSTFLEGDTSIDQGLRVLAWADVCPAGDRIEKIAEASYAEVYRVTNARGTSIIKAIRLASPVRPQTKAQTRSGLVDEEPHDEADLHGELAISEWLADVPGFVVYKERYVVRGRAPRALLETHQAFQRRAKRQDPGRLQFYPSPSRYLDETRFLVIELGDAGRALEDVPLETPAQLWDIFLLVATALARAEALVKFEHRDLHEGNLCVRQVAPAREKAADDASPVVFGYSGLDITILDYGLSRAEAPEDDDDGGDGEPIAFDLEKDLSLFTSTHAAQCRVYRQMRSYLLKGDRVHLPPACHQTPYAAGPDGRPVSWKTYSPYTNVLWLAYLYGYLVRQFRGERAALARFRRETRELWQHLNPDAPMAVLSFAGAADVVRFAVEAGWLTEAQLAGVGADDETSFWSTADTDADGDGDPDESVCGNGSIIEAQTAEQREQALRRSPRRRRPVARYQE